MTSFETFVLLALLLVGATALLIYNDHCSVKRTARERGLVNFKVRSYSPPDYDGPDEPSINGPRHYCVEYTDAEGVQHLIQCTMTWFTTTRWGPEVPLATADHHDPRLTPGPD
jgi:hypothetical protein